MTSVALSHAPVMAAEVVEALAVRDGGVYVDGTFGAGGYSRAILAAASGCVVWALDRDPVVAPFADAVAADHPGRFHLVPGRFGAMDRLLPAHGVTSVAGVALDLGLSSLQLDDPGRGFSFQHDGPLDMRMGAGGEDGETAADVVNGLGEADLADVIRRLGEERHARRVARAIVAARTESPITRTARLAEVVRAAIPGAARQQAREGIDPATRTFQALRLHVNDEAGELTAGLAAAERLLAPGGRLVVVSFHSLEDRVVKAFMRDRSGDRPNPSRHQPAAANDGSAPAPTFRAVGRRALRPGEAEVMANPRARSARLRVAERTDAPAPGPARALAGGGP
ncbi:16S rRNA (cytosine(1402)-N(4))-methyltransferase RsmH [Roseospira goensis]|uniref:Ribosomal RNA small subunit methyltransferase H n=1 Tax=Roseospira goensis TaxID=391922 RepID=A0A7W6S0K8_9PROT|nr:16S rRNA (cytosine(1402)-N(4))-methyltransferase RsmH [Roseospira goensis]MBB4286643.1 16S rRNA (cytosine1402-N4)-methyltransferase [Roseospira goensis]